MQEFKGIIATVYGSELSELLKKQAEFHSERAAFHKDRAAKLKALTEAGNDGSAFVNNTSYAATPEHERASDRAREHENKSRYLLFVAAHVPADAAFHLAESDLRTLGVIR